jgi:hypothetical protein
MHVPESADIDCASGEISGMLTMAAASNALGTTSMLDFETAQHIFDANCWLAKRRRT